MNDFSATPELVLLPAVDVAGGKAVRLTQGEAGTETFHGDPVDAALDFARQGATWIHLVDLDAAFGRGNNTAVLRKVIKQVKGVQVELSGGIRDDRFARSGARSAVPAASTSAPRRSRTPNGQRMSSPATARSSPWGWTCAARRSRRGAGPKTAATCGRSSIVSRRPGCSRYVVTDVTKDGTLKGPNLDLLRQVTSRTPKPVVASGGVSSLDDIAALRELVPLGVEGAIVGRALYAGAFTLAEALDVAAG